MYWGTSRIWIIFIFWIIQLVSPEPISFDAVENSSPSFVSIFSPRMDFDQWKPLTGRGDPLRNDPTYDYEPPVLERVHYWADETRLEREHYPDRKSEVLMLGVSSRKPSVVSRPPAPPAPPRKHHRPPPQKYEDFTYKFNDNFPMTILVPPPPPPPGHKPSLYVVTDDKLPPPTLLTKVTDSTVLVRDTTTPKVVTYALQESNLIYQSSTVNQNWLYNYNETKALPNKAISSDYAGWGPTTPFEKGSMVNTSDNLILSDNKKEHNKEPYLFYKPMLSESPPPKVTSASILLPTFVPPISQTTVPVTSTERMTSPVEDTTSHTAETQTYYDETTTENIDSYTFLPTPVPNIQPKPNVGDMLKPMMSMPMIPDSNRPEDNLYAHASETIQIFKDHPTAQDVMKLEVLQTMLPPPFNLSETATLSHNQPVHVNQHIDSNFVRDKPAAFTHDPYLHMRFTTPIPTTASLENMKTTTEAPSIPMYLIIQGHSKVKTYGSKPKASSSLSNEIPRLNETNEVKHLHPIKQKQNKNTEKSLQHRAGRAKNLKSLVDNGLGSIEIQETDVGIKYDVSDGSDVPIEIYRKGIVDSEENNYSSINKSTKENRAKRQIDLEDLLPFDEDTLEEYVYNFFNRKRNETGITGLLAQAITSDSAATLDNLEDDDDSSGNEDR